MCRFVSGPVFCRPAGAAQWRVTGLPAGDRDWCRAGATTSLASHRAWLARTIEYLDSNYQDTTQQLEMEDKPEEEEEVERNNCSTDPCGSNAQCWNGEGEAFLCTCQPDFPHGNPYQVVRTN